MLFLAEIHRGLRCRVFALGNEEAGRVEVPYFELCASLQRRAPLDLAQLERLLVLTKDIGPPFALGKADRVADSPLYEMRTHRGTRLFWVFGGAQSVVLLSGYQKQSQGIPRRELARAHAWYGALQRNDVATLIARGSPGTRIRCKRQHARKSARRGGVPGQTQQHQNS